MSHNFLRSNTTAYSVAIWKVTINFLLKFPVNSGDGGRSELYGTNRQVVKFKMRLIKVIIFFPLKNSKKINETFKILLLQHCPVKQQQQQQNIKLRVSKIK